MFHNKRTVLKSINRLDPLYDNTFGGPSSSFFDFGPVWDELKFNILPYILSHTADGEEFHAWVIACSTGEEAYSLAMVFKEVIETIRPHSGISLKIVATDINAKRIEFAKRGIYLNQCKNGTYKISHERLNRFFSKNGYFGQRYQVNDELKSMINFEVHNVLTDPPFAGNVFISCANFVHYISFEDQKKLVSLIFENLISRGVWWHLHKVFFKAAGFNEKNFKGWSTI